MAEVSLVIREDVVCTLVSAHLADGDCSQQVKRLTTLGLSCEESSHTAVLILGSPLPWSLTQACRRLRSLSADPEFS